MSTDFETFHTVDVPRLAAGANGALAAPYARDLPPIAFRVGDRGSYTYRSGGPRIEATAGENDAGTAGAVHDAEGARAAPRWRPRRPAGPRPRPPAPPPPALSPPPAAPVVRRR